ncbi:2-amino-4-hydroxy-6-hydroxymethyldihydropteridine diphosphokinase [Helicobacter sp. CLO-3]|nr:2-amino-4-hydroxy-6-hydroxymethyldihydropteridine diphosphokinase [Helicobacter sp. CLO-3]OHU84563.1 2-amino-4-hydroxy-6-hydroxymethyldihydropteridine diphosphokinase [Helicobacter sp. CLO-3]
MLGIGANIGTKAQIKSRFFHLLRFFARHPRFSLIRTSPIYHNPPFGYANQPYFYNAIFALRASLSVIEAFALVFYLERKFGRARQRAHKNAPRTLDIDIIFYDQLILKRPYLTIPHPKYHERPSVLVPMALARILA